MSRSESLVSSRISRFAADWGLMSLGSMEPEQTAHLPLSRDGQLGFLEARETKIEKG